MELLRLSRGFVLQGLTSCSVLLFGCLSFVASASAMSVEEAYRAIPHRYTPFDAKAVRMSPRDAAFLQEFFRLVNSAIVERVQVQGSLQSETQKGSGFPQYQRAVQGLITRLESQTVPDNLKGVHRSVVDAIKDQTAYFEDWWHALSKGEPFTRHGTGNSRVATSSQKLHQAYAALMQAYPQESERTKQAFFDHLCALDLI
jgi:hypothetical protein